MSVASRCVEIEQRRSRLRRSHPSLLGVVDLESRLDPAVLVGVDEAGEPHHQRLAGVIEVPEDREQPPLVIGLAIGGSTLDQAAGTQHVISRIPQGRRQLVQGLDAWLGAAPSLDVAEI